MVSTDTDGGGYEWYMYEVRTKFSKRHELFVHFSTMKYMCVVLVSTVQYVCVHTPGCTHIHLEVLIFLVHVQYLHAL